MTDWRWTPDVCVCPDPAPDHIEECQRCHRPHFTPARIAEIEARKAARHT